MQQEQLQEQECRRRLLQVLRLPLVVLLVEVQSWLRLHAASKARKPVRRGRGIQQIRWR
jgi:hypothetical protein